MLGISKRELLEDYYFDEFLMVLEAYNDMNRLDPKAAEEVQYVDAEDW